MPTGYPPGHGRTSPPTDTPFPTPTATPRPTIVPPVLTVTASNLPRLARDVLFLADGSLKYWHGQTGQIETLLGPDSPAQPSGPGAVSLFTVSDDNRFIALQRVGQAAMTYEVALLELETRELTTIQQGTALDRGVLGLAFSPDGQWLAYVAQGTVPAARPADEEGTGTVYAVRTDAADLVIELGECGRLETDGLSLRCLNWGRLLWSPNGAPFVWSDGYGLWLGQVGRAARLLAPNHTDVSDEAQVFSAWAWSPAGDYLLAWINHFEGVSQATGALRYQGSSQAVVDVASGNVIPIPDTFESGEPVARASWLTDGRLFVVRRVGSVGAESHLPEAYSLFAEIWHISPADSALALDQTLPIVDNAEGSPTMTGIERLTDSRLAFGILSKSNGDYETRGLYTFAPGDARLRKVTGLPPISDYRVEPTWAPDGSGAFIHRSAGGRLLYAPGDGSAVYEVGRALDGDECCLTWLKPP
jgi:hypothetical protein